MKMWNIFKRFSDNRQNVPIPAVILFVAIIVAIAGVAIVSELYLFAGALCAAIPLVVVFLYQPRWWVYTGIGLLYIWLRSSDADISALELMLIAFYLGGLFLWFIQKIVRRSPIVRNGADKLIILVYIIVLLFNSGIALFNGASLLLWSREFLLLTFLLLYFPIREYITEHKHVRNLLIILAGVVFALGITNIQLYISAKNNALQAADLLNSRVSLNETIFVCAALFSIVFFLHSKRWYNKVILLLLSVYYASVLLASLSRGPWLAFIIGAVWIFIFIGRKKKLEMGILVVSATSIVVIVISLFFGSMGTLIIRGIEMRFLSSAKGAQDISVKSRLVESEAALKVFLSHPLGGIGLGGAFNFYDPIGQITLHKTFTHNGYLFIAFKWGGPLAVLFFTALLLYLYYGQQAILKNKGKIFYRELAIAGSSTLLASFVLNIPANQFIMRDSLCFLALSITCISIAQAHARTSHDEPVYLP
jgi:O-antigen ligase